MILKVVLVINTLVYLLLGLAFIFVPGQMSMGVLPPLGEVFMRALGGVFIGLSIISWYAKNETKSKLLFGVLLGNMVAHFLQAGGDVYAMQRGLLNSGGGISVGIHAVLGFAFLLVLFRIENSRK